MLGGLHMGNISITGNQSGSDNQPATGAQATKEATKEDNSEYFTELTTGHKRKTAETDENIDRVSACSPTGIVSCLFGRAGKVAGTVVQPQNRRTSRTSMPVIKSK